VEENNEYTAGVWTVPATPARGRSMPRDPLTRPRRVDGCWHTISRADAGEGTASWSMRNVLR